MKELRELAKSRGIKGYSKLKKQELIDLLSPAAPAPPPPAAQVPQKPKNNRAKAPKDPKQPDIKDKVAYGKWLKNGGKIKGSYVDLEQSELLPDPDLNRPEVQKGILDALGPKGWELHGDLLSKKVTIDSNEIEFTLKLSKGATDFLVNGEWEYKDTMSPQTKQAVASWLKDTDREMLEGLPEGTVLSNIPMAGDSRAALRVISYQRRGYGPLDDNNMLGQLVNGELLPIDPRKYDFSQIEGSTDFFNLSIGDKVRELSRLNAPPGTQPLDPNAFPSYDDLSFVGSLGGSTGAEKVVDSRGNSYVLKYGNSPGHLQDEVYADTLYQMAGLEVPEFEVIDTPKGKAKLSRFLEGSTPLGNLSGSEETQANQQLKGGYLIDALLGNWDVIGMSGDNVLVSEGKVYRVDNGGSLRYRAQGSKKQGDQWNEYPTELWSMKKSTQGSPVFGGLKPLDLIIQEPRLLRLEKELKDKPLGDKALMETLEARIQEAKKTLQLYKELVADGYDPEYIELFADKIMDLKNAGGLKNLPKQLKSVKTPKFVNSKPVDYQTVTPKDEKGKKYDDLRGDKAKRAQFFKDWMEKNGGDWDLMVKYQKAQGGSSWSDWSVVFKSVTEAIRPAREGRYWAKFNRKADLTYDLGFKGKDKKFGFDTVLQTYATTHAINYLMMSEVDMGIVNNGKVKLYRTESPNTVARAGFTDVKQIRSWARGALESASMFRPVEAVAGANVFEMEVPVHRTFSNYIWNAREPYSAFAGDGENEITVDMGDIKAQYLGVLDGGIGLTGVKMPPSKPGPFKISLSDVRDAFESQQASYQQSINTPNPATKAKVTVPDSSVAIMKSALAANPSTLQNYLTIALNLGPGDQSKLYYSIPELAAAIDAVEAQNPGTYDILPKITYAVLPQP